MMKRRNFNLIKTGRKSKLALAVGLALAMSAMGSVYASGNDDMFKNFANKDALMKTAEGFKTQEFKNSTGLEAIGANKAYALGYSGDDTYLGMIELSQPHISNDDLYGNICKDGDLLLGKPNDILHATHVAGIILAKKSGLKDNDDMHGVAYNSKLYTYQVDTGVIKPLLLKIPDSVIIINESFGFPSGLAESIVGSDMRILNSKLAANGKLIIHAAGNDSMLERIDLMDAYTDNTKHNFIGVAGINQNKKTNESNFLNPVSNLPGSLKSNFVMAPSANINSTLPNNKYGEMSGTSMAAPYVTGTAALVQEACPYLTGKQIGDIILSTANNKFELAPCYFQMQVSKDGTENGEDRYKIDKIRQIFIKQDGVQVSATIGEKVIGEFFDLYIERKNIRYTDRETFIKNILKNKDKIWEVVELPFDEVFGQGVVDAGKAVQGLGAIDVDRLSKDDITTKYSNDKFYMYKVDTKKVADNFRGRNYSIWNNDIGDKNVTGINAGLEKTGDVKLILLGENTYGGATVAKGGFLQIVRGVGGDVYVGGDSNVAASAEINGYAKNIYALESGKVKISDIVSKNYANVDADFLAVALPDTNKVDINGGLFAIGKNSITGEGSTINVHLTRSDSAIKGALYQDELGKINLSLANEAKFILQQGTGYYAGNSYKSNDTVNNLRMDSFATFDMSQDGVYSTLKIDKLQGRDGQFILGTDLANCKGDSIFVTGSDAGEHWISIVDKNGIYADNEDGAKKVLLATTPDNVKFKGLALAQDMGVNQYNFNPNIYYDENLKGWYFDGFKNTFEKPSSNTSWIYTTNDVINEGIHIGNDSINVKVIQKETPAMIIRSNLDDKYSVYPIVISKNKYLNFVGDGAIEVYNNLDDLNNGDKYFHVADSSAILNDGDINVHQRIILTSKNEDKNTPVGIYRSIENYGNLSFFNELEINHSVNYSHTSEAIYNLGKMDIGKKFTINISADTNINSPTGIYNGYETKKGGKYIFGEINAKDDSFITITDDLKNKSLRTATAIENKGKMIFEKDLNIILPGNTSTGPCSWDYADGIENNGIHFTYSDSPWSPTYSVDEGSYFEVKD